MANKESSAVKEVEEVLEVLNEYLNLQKDIPYFVVKKLINNLHKIEEDYNKTINDLLLSNSLVVKMEKVLELIGTLSASSVENEEKMDTAIKLLSEI